MRLPVFYSGLAPLFAFYHAAAVVIHCYYRVCTGNYNNHVAVTYLPFNINTIQKTNYSFLTKN